MTYQICTRCVMDTSDPGITFDEEGVCSKCHFYDEKFARSVRQGEEGHRIVQELVKEIQSKCKGKDYDCILGMSGGVDSSYALHYVVSIGLRPLVVHLDNGWNSKTAAQNIGKMLRKLEVDLHTHVIDWEEFRDLQLAYLRASVVDIEALTDHAIKAVLYKTAYEKNIPYIITGTNLITEGIVGSKWGHNKSDYVNILDIHATFGSRPLKTFPILKLFERGYYQVIKGITTVEILNYSDYQKSRAEQLLRETYGWEPYGKKHGESIFTKFYQNYILPTKFGIDKRRAHFSSFINSGEMTREEALEELNKPLYEPEELSRDMEYVLKKFGLTQEEFDAIMAAPPKSHYDYKSADSRLRAIRSLYKTLFRR